MTPRGHHHHSRLLTARRERRGRERERRRRGEEREREKRHGEERERGERRRGRERRSRRLGIPVSGDSLQGFASRFLMREKEVEACFYRGRVQVPHRPKRHGRACGRKPLSPLVHSACVFLRARDALTSHHPRTLGPTQLKRTIPPLFLLLPVKSPALVGPPPSSSGSDRPCSVLRPLPAKTRRDSILPAPLFLPCHFYPMLWPRISAVFERYGRRVSFLSTLLREVRETGSEIYDTTRPPPPLAAAHSEERETRPGEREKEARRGERERRDAAKREKEERGGAGREKEGGDG
ncbi:hypothetical protein IGI04_014286 [Brassica rapa subsp. trilocularis]|uniref:Uncharacterized protein n=1 Tax=Brassica rapa subsp. trilocularis TaxID=1813537 RepID=A0ABQ7MLS6_BRACM|nr:hypothetical protein IGI04_014286 [Brassica rapa subsp. trilocularis]